MATSQPPGAPFSASLGRRIKISTLRARCQDRRGAGLPVSVVEEAPLAGKLFEGFESLLGALRLCVAHRLQEHHSEHHGCRVRIIGK